MSNRHILDFVKHEQQLIMEAVSATGVGNMNMTARSVAALTCVQESGDIMIVPENWGHGVLNLQVNW